MWSLEGLYVEGIYLNIPVSGKVGLSRVAYGGEVHHHVDLNEPIVLFGSVRERVILSHKEVTKVYSNPSIEVI